MMPAYPFLFIDLDGTITDSIRGVLNAVEYALARIGRPYPRAELGFMMGPPLRDGFGRLLGDDTLAQRCVSLYREYYTDRGIFECTVYDGVPEMLKGLRAAGCRISLATSKPIPFAQRILDHFHLTGLFDIVDGADMTGPVQHKPDVLKRAMGRLGADPASSLMVGDRFYDVDGAHAVGMACAAVLYGYGSEEELARAEFLCKTPCDVVPCAAAAIGTMPRKLVAVVMFTLRLSFIIEASDTRFAEVVDSRPHEVSDDIGMVVDPCPVGECVARVRFRLHHDARRDAFVVRRTFVHHVVVTHDVMRGSQRVVDFPIFVPCRKGGCHRAAGVEAAYMAC